MLDSGAYRRVQGTREPASWAGRKTKTRVHILSVLHVSEIREERRDKIHGRTLIPIQPTVLFFTRRVGVGNCCTLLLVPPVQAHTTYNTPTANTFFPVCMLP
jgi:hypothetical protein